MIYAPNFVVSFQACRHGNVQHLEHLLFYGADMSSQNASGNTALHLCALYNQVTHIEPWCFNSCFINQGLLTSVC